MTEDDSRANRHGGAGRNRQPDHEDQEVYGSHGGRASSWLAVTVIVLGFAIGGVGLCAGPNWFLFWMGATVCAMGAILLFAFGVFQDVVLEAPRAPYRSPGQSRRGLLG